MPTNFDESETIQQLLELRSTTEVIAAGGNRSWNAMSLSTGHTIFYYVVGANWPQDLHGAQGKIQRDEEWAIIHDHKTESLELWINGKKHANLEEDELASELIGAITNPALTPSPLKTSPVASGERRRPGSWKVLLLVMMLSPFLPQLFFDGVNPYDTQNERDLWTLAGICLLTFMLAIYVLARIRQQPKNFTGRVFPVIVLLTSGFYCVATVGVVTGRISID